MLSAVTYGNTYRNSELDIMKRVWYLWKIRPKRHDFIKSLSSDLREPCLKRKKNCSSQWRWSTSRKQDLQNHYDQAHKNSQRQGQESVCLHGPVADPLCINSGLFCLEIYGIPECVNIGLWLLSLFLCSFGFVCFCFLQYWCFTSVLFCYNWFY